MTGTFGAFASRLAAALVALDKRAAQDCLQRGQLAQQSCPASAQLAGGLVVHHGQTTCITGLIVLAEKTFFKFLVQACSVAPPA